MNFNRNQFFARFSGWLFVALVAGTFAVGCSSVSRTDNATTSSNSSSKTLPGQDEFVAFDEPSHLSSTQVSDELLADRLEEARQHYVAALEAQVRDDSTHVAIEFERAIDILNSVVALPQADSNAEFSDLARSIVEDYEKYIAKGHDLGPDASVAALREKLSIEVESNVEEQVTLIAPVPVSTTQVPMTMNDYVQRNLAFFTQNERGRQFMTKWLERAGKYFPMIKRVLAEEGVPEEIMYLTMIESGVNPASVSWAKAVGMWQFIKGTGLMYGLKANVWFDERRDPEKATRAAARHLHDLYNELGNWHSALASYNCGVNRVRNAIAIRGTNDYWAIRDLLPRETRNYVPIYIAASLVALDPVQYGFPPINFNDGLKYETVRVNEMVDLSALARCAHCELEDLRTLNPELCQWMTPPTSIMPEGYTLKVPVGSPATFTEELGKLPESAKRTMVIHNVRRRETLSSVAHRYGISAERLATANGLGLRSKLHAGMTLHVPLTSETAVTHALAKIERDGDDPASKEVRGKGKRTVIKVKRTETSITQIAKHYGVRPSDIRNWNNISYRTKHLSAGRSLVIYEPKSSERWITHTVKAGENYGTIASRYGVSIAELKRWNKVKTLHAGYPLKVEVGSSANLTRHAGASKNDLADRPSKVHFVKRGESLASIAEANGTTINQLKTWNNLHSSNIIAGSKIKIYSEETTGKGDYQKGSTNGPERYRIRKGDNWGSIAKKFGVSIASLEALNPISAKHGLKARTTIIIKK